MNLLEWSGLIHVRINWNDPRFGALSGMLERSRWGSQKTYNKCHKWILVCVILERNLQSFCVPYNLIPHRLIDQPRTHLSFRAGSHDPVDGIIVCRSNNNIWFPLDLAVKFLREVTPYFRKASIICLEVGWELQRAFLCPLGPGSNASPPAPRSPPRADTRYIPLQLTHLARNLKHPDPGK